MIHADRKRVLRALQDDLAYLGPEDRMAVVAWNGREIEMLSSWTSDTRALRRVFDVAMSRPAYGLQRVAEERIFGADGFNTLIRPHVVWSRAESRRAVLYRPSHRPA